MVDEEVSWTLPRPKQRKRERERESAREGKRGPVCGPEKRTSTQGGKYDTTQMRSLMELAALPFRTKRLNTTYTGFGDYLVAGRDGCLVVHDLHRFGLIEPTQSPQVYLYRYSFLSDSVNFFFFFNPPFSFIELEAPVCRGKTKPNGDVKESRSIHVERRVKICDF